MAEGENPVEHAGKGLQGFLSKETAGLPNWVWLLIVGAGIGVAYILPRFVNVNNSGSSTDTAGALPGAGAVDIGTQQSQSDMLSAFSNYLNQLTQQGATTLAALQSIQAKLNPPAPKPKNPPTPAKPPTLAGGGHLPPTVPGPIQPIAKQPIQRSVTVTRWPNNGSTLQEIARQNGTTVQHLQQLNPGIKDLNKIQAGEQIRVR